VYDFPPSFARICSATSARSTWSSAAPTRDSGRLPGRADTRISYTSILQLW